MHVLNLNKIVLLLIVCLGFSCTATKIAGGKQLKDLTDVVYGNNIDTIGKVEPNTLDIYFPKNAVTGNKYPLVMMVHGGGFINGNKNNMAKTCQRFADSGFVAVTVEYRMGWSERDPKMSDLAQLNTQMAASYRAIQDVNAAMRFLVSKADDYSIDTRKIFVGGASAGAIATLALTYVTDDYANKHWSGFVEKLGGLHNATNSLTNSYNVRGICSMWGALPDSNLIDKRSAVPAIFFHGTADKTVPADAGPGMSKVFRMFGTVCLYRQMQKYGTPGIVYLSVGSGHGPAEYKEGTFVTDNAICFFKNLINNKPTKGGIYYGLDNSCNK